MSGAKHFWRRAERKAGVVTPERREQEGLPAAESGAELRALRVYEEVMTMQKRTLAREGLK